MQQGDSFASLNGTIIIDPIQPFALSDSGYGFIFIVESQNNTGRIVIDSSVGRYYESQANSGVDRFFANSLCWLDGSCENIFNLN